MTSPAYEDPYVTLGLTRTATMAEIKQAYFTLVRSHPPERDPAGFKRIRAAYERLREPDKRAETDMLLIERWPAATRPRRPLRFEPRVHPADVIALARSLTELNRTDWREHHGKVSL